MEEQEGGASSALSKNMVATFITFGSVCTEWLMIINFSLKKAMSDSDTS
jgi:hypothetical protein